MKKNSSGKRGAADSVQQNSPPDKTGWIRKFCGKGIFREIWKNRFVVLKGDQLFICEKEVKELGRADEVLDLSDYERCEEIRKNKSRSKKNHSKFRLQRCSSPGNTVPNLIFLAVSPEEKDSWINVLNTAITRAKNRILDEVLVEDSQLSHLTRDRVRIPHNRRLPTRGHLLAVASTSSSDGTLTLDLIQEADPAGDQEAEAEPPARPGPDCPRSQTDGALSGRTAESSTKSQSLPRETVVWHKTGTVRTPQPDRRPGAAEEKNRCASMDQILDQTALPAQTAAPLGRLQELIHQKLEKTERLLTEVRSDGEPGKRKADVARGEAERLLKEATAAWKQAREVLEEVQELKALYRQLEAGGSASNTAKLTPNCKSLM